jgi:hypothetical protein
MQAACAGGLHLVAPEDCPDGYLDPPGHYQGAACPVSWEPGETSSFINGSQQAAVSSQESCASLKVSFASALISVSSCCVHNGINGTSCGVITPVKNTQPRFSFLHGHEQAKPYVMDQIPTSRDRYNASSVWLEKIDPAVAWNRCTRVFSRIALIFSPSSVHQRIATDFRGFKTESHPGFCGLCLCL